MSKHKRMKHLTKSVAVLVTSIVFGAACYAPVYAAQNISGTVTHAADGTPVTTLSVRVYDSDAEYLGSATTDANGEYTYEADAGDYIVQTNTSTADEANVVFIRAEQTVSVTDADVENVDFSLTRRGRITGHVYQSDGVTPIYNVYVSAYHQNGYDAGYDGDSSGLDGSYIIIPDLNDVPGDSASGVYSVYANLAHYFGADALNVSVTDEETTTVDLVMNAESTVAGTVTDSNGDPVVDVVVSAKKGSDTYSDATDSSGEYIIEMYDTYGYNETAAGDYVLSTDKEGYIDKSRLITVGVESATTDEDFTIETGGTISGTVYGSDGETPVSGAAVSADDGLGNTYTTTTATDGSYTLSGLRASDNYTITITDDDHITVVEYNVSVTAGEDTAADDISMDDGVTFSGRVKTKAGANIEGATIALYSRLKPRSGTADHTTSTYTDGRFSISSIIPGRYRMKIEKDGYVMKYKEKLGLKKSKSSKVYKMTKGASFYGRVKYKKKPLANVTVRVYRGNGYTDQGYAYTSTDSNGFYKLDGLKKGKYRIYVSSSDYGYKIVRKRVKAGKQKRVNIKMKRAGTISGHVYDADTGLPLSLRVQVKGTPLSTSSGTGGYYILDGLNPGKYKLFVADEWYDTQFYNRKKKAKNAAKVQVKANQTTSGVDFYVNKRD